jgi:hypothetical protein
MSVQFPNTPPKPQTSLFVDVVSGGTGGAVGVTLATPFMYFKRYFQEKAKNPEKPPVFEKNPVKWFKGAPGMAAWMFPLTGFNFTMTDVLKRKLSNNGERELTFLEKIACSATTGALSASIVTTQELLWTQEVKAEEERMKKILEQKLDPKQVPSKNIMQVAQDVWNKQGIKGFFRAGAETGAREMVFATVLTSLVEEHPIAAPVVGATISQPVDMRKNYKQGDFNYKAPLSDLFKVKSVTTGLISRVGVFLVFMNVAPVVKEEVKKKLS